MCDWLHTTPADPRLLDMTEEQVDDLWLQFNHLHPGRFKTDEAQFVDHEFEEFERELAEEGKGVLYETTAVIPYGETSAPVFVSDQWEDV